MKSPRWKMATWVYYGCVTALGWSVVVMSLRTVLSAQPMDWTWLLLAIPLTLLHRTYIQLPNCDGRICPSGLFVLYAGLVWGPAPAALIAVLDATYNSLQQSSARLKRLLFNLAVLPLAIYLAVSIGAQVGALGVPQADLLLARATVVTVLYYVINLGLVLGMMALTGGAAAIAATSSALLWSWAEYLVGGLVATLLVQGGANIPAALVIGSGVLALTFKTLKHYFRVLEQREEALKDKVRLLGEKEHLLVEKEGLLTEKEGLLAEVRATHLASLETLALAIEAKDPLTHGHIRRVQKLAVALGEAIQMEHGELEALRIAALLHDIGKLAIPEYLLYRNKKLTQEDEEKLKNHARLGADILRNSRLSPQVMLMVRHHHERYDGCGYPYGLLGEDTILGARVLAVADTWDKLRRPHSGEGLARARALARMRAEAGTALDPHIVQALLGLSDERLDQLESDEVSESPFSSQTVGGGRPSFVTDFFTSHKESRAFYGLIQEIRSTPELEPRLRLMASVLGEASPYSAMLILLPDAGGEGLEVAYAEGIDMPDQEAWPGTRWLTALRNSLASGINRFDADFPDLLGELTSRSALEAFTVFPLQLGPTDSGYVLLGHGDELVYSEEQRRLIKVLLQEAGPAITNARYYERFRCESLTDALTGLANGRALRERGGQLIDHTIADNRQGCVVMLDLNGFKQVNDTLGHHQGDSLLVQVARALSRHMGKGGLVARNGGDEFVMILPDVAPEAIEERLARLHDEVCRLWPEDWTAGAAGVSAGVAWFPEEGASLGPLMEQADTRMYNDKRAKKSNVTYLNRLPRAQIRIAQG